MKLDTETQNKLLIEELTYRNELVRIQKETENFQAFMNNELTRLTNAHNALMNKYRDEFCKANGIEAVKVKNTDIISGEMEVEDAS